MVYSDSCPAFTSRLIAQSLFRASLVFYNREKTMAGKVVVGLVVLAALINALVPGAPGEILGLVLLVLGLAHGYMSVDADDATAFLVFAAAAWVAGSANVLGNLDMIAGIGGYLDGILDGVVVALLGAVVTVVVMRTVNVLKG